MTTEDLGPSERIAAYVRERIAQGRIYHPTKVIATGTGLSRKVIGTRIWMMSNADWHGLDISKWSDKTWRIALKVKQNGSKAI